jgi:hypothetical protein
MEEIDTKWAHHMILITLLCTKNVTNQMWEIDYSNILWYEEK